jgi:glyoxylase-like metal-dependent hydrolase (beta-lactamase superfamily II)
MVGEQKIADGVHRFDADGVNFYAIEGDDGLTIVDAGFPGHWLSLTTWLFKTGSAPRDIAAILLTHNHPDHIGFAGTAHDAGAAVRIHADDLAGLTDGAAMGLPDRFKEHAWRPATARRLLRWVRMGAASGPSRLSEVLPCTDGDRLDVPGNPRVVHVPGHTPGSAAFVFEDHDVICVGDALATYDPSSSKNGISILPSGLNADDAQALASLDRLVDETASLVLPGHGEPYHDGITSAIHAARAIGANW